MPGTSGRRFRGGVNGRPERAFIVGWGDNGDGQYTVPVPNSRYSAIATGEQHSLAIWSRIGDIDGDGYVNVFDVVVISEAWNTQAGDPNFNPACDLDGDGMVNVFDIFILAENWNR